MAKDPAYDIVLGGVGLILARANQLQEGARAWKVEVQHNPVSATSDNSARYGGVGPQVEMPLVWDDLSGGYGSWSDRVERKYHWGYNIDTRFPGLILPGPYLHVVTIGGTVPVHDFEEHDGKLWVAAGRYVKAIAATTTYTVSPGLDAGSGKTVTDIEEWKGNLYAGQGFGSGDYLCKHAAGAAVDTWTEDNDVQVGYMCTLYDKMYASVSSYGVAAVANDPMTLGDWTATYTIGDSSRAITSLEVLEDELYIGKRDGLYGLDSSGIGTMLSPELKQYRSPVNCKGMKVWHGTLIVPHLRGLLQYAGRGDGTHSVAPIGPGRSAMADNPILGHVTAVCGDEKYLYVALWTGQYNATTGGTTYILAGCFDEKLGAWAWHPLIKFADDKRCDAMFISSLWTVPHLWMGYGEDAAYIKIPRGVDNPYLDSNSRYATSGTIRFQRHDLFAPATYKVWKSVEIEADNLSPSRYLTVYTRADNGDWVSWGNAYQSPRTKIVFGSEGIAGKTIELRLDYTMPGNITPIVIRSAVLRAAERPDSVEMITAVVRCDDKLRLRNGGYNRRTGAETWTALRAMLDHSGTVTLKDTLGTEKEVLVIAPLEQTEARSEGDLAPEMLATIHMVVWDEQDVNMRMVNLNFGYGANGWDIEAGTGWELSAANGWQMGATDASVMQTISYAGTANTRPIIAITGQITGVVVKNLTTGQTLSAGFNVAAGETYTIDCAKKTIVNNSGAAVAVTIGDFFLVPGDNVITLTGTNISGDTACKITYRTENLIP